jgi:hypothetical protein
LYPPNHIFCFQARFSKPPISFVRDGYGNLGNYRIHLRKKKRDLKGIIGPRLEAKNIVFERYQQQQQTLRAKILSQDFEVTPLGSGLKLIFLSTPYVLELRQSTDTPQGKDFAGTHRNSTEGFLKKVAPSIMNYLVASMCHRYVSASTKVR